MVSSRANTSNLRDHLAKLGAIQKGTPVANDLVGAQTPLREVVVELSATLTKLTNRIVNRDQISHAPKASTDCTDVLDKTAQVCNTNAMDNTATTPLADITQYLCPNGHGPMVARSETHLSPEQRWCGQWWDCAPSPGMCTSSILIPSRKLECVS